MIAALGTCAAIACSLNPQPLPPDNPDGSLGDATGNFADDSTPPSDAGTDAEDGEGGWTPDSSTDAQDGGDAEDSAPGDSGTTDGD